jgi:hypothetical protein
VDLNAGLRLRRRVGVAAKVRTLLRHQYPLVELAGYAFGNGRAEEAGADAGAVVRIRRMIRRMRSSLPTVSDRRVAVVWPRPAVARLKRRSKTAGARPCVDSISRRRGLSGVSSSPTVEGCDCLTIGYRHFRHNCHVRTIDCRVLRHLRLPSRN